MLFLFFSKNVCRVFLGHSVKSSSSARRKTLGKTSFADKPVAECRLLSVTLGKRFAKWFGGFADCPWHLAKLLYPVVHQRCFLLTRWPWRKGDVGVVLVGRKWGTFRGIDIIEEGQVEEHLGGRQVRSSTSRAYTRGRHGWGTWPHQAGCGGGSSRQHHYSLSSSSNSKIRHLTLNLQKPFKLCPSLFWSGFEGSFVFILS